MSGPSVHVRQSVARRVRAGPRRARSVRRGLTLYEVLISLAIFLPALAVLGQAISNGGRAAVQAQLQTEAVLRCDSVISELVAGVQPLTPISGSLFADGAPGWSWSLEVWDGPYTGVQVAEVSVVHVDSNDQVNASASLTRYVWDPQLLSDAAAAQASSSSAQAP